MYNIEFPKLKKTLQVFITNKCNKRCYQCFFANRFGLKSMSVQEYINVLDTHSGFEKVILLGGEPLMCENLDDILKVNIERQINTTMYTNGSINYGKKDLLCSDRIKLLSNDLIDLRVGILGVRNKEKVLNHKFVYIFKERVTVVYMLRQDNVEELPFAAETSYDLGCRDFYISSVLDVDQTGHPMKYADDTLNSKEYSYVIRSFLSQFKNPMRIHVALRGIHPLDLFRGLINPIEWGGEKCNTCRIGNVFVNGDKIQCPFDISLNNTTDEIKFNSKCKWHKWCILQKAILSRGYSEKK